MANSKLLAKSDALKQYARNIIKNFHLDVQPRFPMRLEDLSTTFDTPKVPIPVGEGATVGIIGAGVGGLYAAMLLRSRGVPYEILEASDRTGGRLFTHKFSDEEHDYFDVGAMRFPKTPLMDPVFNLFDTLNLTEKLAKYYFENPNSTLFFNSILRRRADRPIYAEDFEITGVPFEYAEKGWPDLVDNVVGPFAQKLAEDVETGGDEGWKLMMLYDQYSTRAYMAGNRSDTRPELDKLKKMPYPLGVVNWCETFDKSTGWYDNALSETVIESLAFAFPDQGGEEPDVEWFCVDGGSSVISDAMVDYLQPDLRLELNSRVTGVALAPGDHSSGKHKVEVTLADGSKRSYAHVITTTTLPCLRTMDLTGAKLDYKQKSSLRQLQYGPSTKIGIKFKTAWWEDPDVMTKLGKYGAIVGGQSFTDNMARTIVYPSYGVQCGKKSTVLIASYAWTADALALSALMGPDPDSKSVLKRRILQDLVLVHGFDKVEGLRFLNEQYLESFPFSWSNNPYTMGAFAFFGPGQFKDLYQHMTRPAAGGRLHFAGEAISDRHAWVVGALEASRRAVDEILHSSYGSRKVRDLEKQWGANEEWADDALFKQIAITLDGLFPEDDEATHQ